MGMRCAFRITSFIKVDFACKKVIFRPVLFEGRDLKTKHDLLFCDLMY